MTTNSQLRKILKYVTYMKIAESISKLSYDPKHQVGSILVKNDFSQIHSNGYNGNYSGGGNERDSMEHGKSGFLHSEENCLLNSSLKKEEMEKYTMFVTMKPCTMCAKRMAVSGVKKVISLTEYKNSGDTETIFTNAKISHKKLVDIVKDIYDENFLMIELKDTLNAKENLISNLNILLRTQINRFFEFSEKPNPNNIILLENDSDISNIKNLYIENFYQNLYKLL